MPLCSGNEASVISSYNYLAQHHGFNSLVFNILQILKTYKSCLSSFFEKKHQIIKNISIFAQLKYKSMRKNNFITIAIAMFLVTVSMAFMSCSKSDISKNIPTDVLPKELESEIKQYMTFYEGNTPPDLNNCWFLSSPNNLIHSSNDPSQDGTQFYDKYVGVYNQVFYWRQKYDSIMINGNWVYDTLVTQSIKPVIVGKGDNFSLYFTQEGMDNGYKIKQSTIYTGTLEKNVGIRNYRVALILLETGGSPDYAPAGSYQVIGDGDGLAEVNNWMNKSLDMECCLDGRNIIEPNFSFRK